MQVKDVRFTTQQVCFKEGGNRYIRINVSRKAVPRDTNTTTLVNVHTGRVRIAAKDREVIPA